jgi:hypothetical protein
MFRYVWDFSPKNTFFTWVGLMLRAVLVDAGFPCDKAALFWDRIQETLRTNTITKLSPITGSCSMANCWRCIYIRLVTIGAGATFCCSKWASGKSKSCRSCCDQVRDLDKGRGTAIMWTERHARTAAQITPTAASWGNQHNTYADEQQWAFKQEIFVIPSK